MITDRDRDILKFLREYKFVTLEQLQKLFFKESKQGYNIARRRMQALLDLGYVCSNKSKYNKKNIYKINDPIYKIKMPDETDLILSDIMAELVYLGFDLKEFYKETDSKNKFGDGFARIEKEDSVLNIVIDVQLTNLNHNTELFDAKSIKKKESIENKKEEYMILVVSDKVYYDLEDIDNFKVRQISTKLIGLKDILSS